MNKNQVLALVAIFLVVLFSFTYSGKNPYYASPLDEPISLATSPVGNTPAAESTAQQLIPEEEKVNVPSPVCGDRAEVAGLLIGIDYRGNGYFSGLADVIRLVQIDFTIPSVNVVALPRDLLVSLPGNQFDILGPLKIAQAYYFGTPGGDHFRGIGDGAGALAAVIQHNFAVTPENYFVLDFQAFVNFIDAIGGIEIDLPTFVDARPNEYFPAGVQTLSGEQALTLARARKVHGEPFRIDSQSLIMRSIFNRLKEPETLLKLPALLNDFRSPVITDLTPAQIVDALCLLQHLKAENIHFFNPGEDLLTASSEYLPSLNGNSFVWKWDQRLLDWIEQSRESTTNITD